MTMTRYLPVIVTAAAAAIVHSPAANADEVSVLEFGDPSRNMSCTMTYYPIGTRGSDHVINTVQCDIDAHTWVGPQVSGGTAPCADPAGYTFMLREAETPTVHCFTEFQAMPTIYTVLEYGQSRTAGSITCISAPDPTGMTCTNTQSGNSFRVSRDSYEVV